MRIKVTGSCISADALRSYLQHKNIGYAVTEFMPDYTIFLDEGAVDSTIVADSIDCELERNIVNCISALTPTPVQLSRAGGVRRDDQIRITIPPDDQARYAVERGILRGLLKTTGTHDGWLRKIKAHFTVRKVLPFVIGLLLLPTQLAHGQVSPTRCIASAVAPTYSEGASFPLSCDLTGGLRTSGGGGGGLTDTQLRASAVHILCDAGTCGGSSPFADNSAFTFGTSGISNIGAVVDDVSTNTVAENSAGAPRMNTNRILYMDISKTLANVNKFVVTADPITFASPQHVITDNTSVTDVQDRAARLLGVTYGSQAAQLQQSATNFNLYTELRTGATAYDARQIRALTSADVVDVSDRSARLLGVIASITAAVDVSDRAARLLGVISTGSNIIGRVGTDQTTHGTTDLVAADITKYGGTATTLGQKAMTASIPTVLASDQAAIPVNATLSAETTKVIGTVRAQGNLGAAFDSAIGAAPPANAVQIAGLASGATGGFMKAVAVGDTFVNVNVVTATTVLLVTGVAGRHVRITSIGLAANGADAFNLLSGTGATCGTGTTGMLGGTTAATGINLLAGGAPFTQGSGIGQINQTNATGDSVCIITSAAVQLSGRIGYSIY